MLRGDVSHSESGAYVSWAASSTLGSNVPDGPNITGSHCSGGSAITGWPLPAAAVASCSDSPPDGITASTPSWPVAATMSAPPVDRQSA